MGMKPVKVGPQTSLVPAWVRHFVSPPQPYWFGGSPPPLRYIYSYQLLFLGCNYVLSCLSNLYVVFCYHLCILAWQFPPWSPSGSYLWVFTFGWECLVAGRCRHPFPTSFPFYTRLCWPGGGALPFLSFLLSPLSYLINIL